YVAYRELLVEDVYPTLEGLKNTLEIQASFDPNAAKGKVEDFVDTRFVDELRKSGFVDLLYNRARARWDKQSNNDRMRCKMPHARALFDQIRRDLEPIHDRLLQHPYLQSLETGQIGREKLRLFAGEQYSIIASDLRSAAQLVNRFGASASR